MDTVCRLYEVGRQRLAEEEEDEDDQVTVTLVPQTLSSKVSYKRCIPVHKSNYTTGYIRYNSQN